MKREIIGAVLLILLLAGGIFSTLWLGKNLESLPPLLDRAAREAEADHWESAALLTERAEQSWQRIWKLTAVFADHGPMEQIDSLFAQLAECEKGRFQPDFGKLCARLARELEALGEANSPSWWNLL